MTLPKKAGHGVRKSAAARAPPRVQAEPVADIEFNESSDVLQRLIEAQLRIKFNFEKAKIVQHWQHTKVELDANLRARMVDEAGRQEDMQMISRIRGLYMIMHQKLTDTYSTEAKRILSRPKLKAPRTKKQPRTNFMSSVHTAMQTWLEEHMDDPYPDNGMKQHFMRVTGLTYDQVSNYFINWRMRVWKPMMLEKEKEMLAAGQKPRTALDKNRRGPKRKDRIASSPDPEDVDESAASSGPGAGNKKRKGGAQRKRKVISDDPDYETETDAETERDIPADCGPGAAAFNAMKEGKASRSRIAMLPVALPESSSASSRTKTKRSSSVKGRAVISRPKPVKAATKTQPRAETPPARPALSLFTGSSPGGSPIGPGPASAFFPVDAAPLRQLRVVGTVASGHATAAPAIVLRGELGVPEPLDMDSSETPKRQLTSLPGTSLNMADDEDLVDAEPFLDPLTGSGMPSTLTSSAELGAFAAFLTSPATSPAAGSAARASIDAAIAGASFGDADAAIFDIIRGNRAFFDSTDSGTSMNLSDSGPHFAAGSGSISRAGSNLRSVSGSGSGSDSGASVGSVSGSHSTLGSGSGSGFWATSVVKSLPLSPSASVLSLRRGSGVAAMSVGDSPLPAQNQVFFRAETKKSAFATAGSSLPMSHNAPAAALNPSSGLNTSDSGSGSEKPPVATARSEGDAEMPPFVPVISADTAKLLALRFSQRPTASDDGHDSVRAVLAREHGVSTAPVVTVHDGQAQSEKKLRDGTDAFDDREIVRLITVQQMPGKAGQATPAKVYLGQWRNQIVTVKCAPLNCQYDQDNLVKEQKLLASLDHERFLKPLGITRAGDLVVEYGGPSVNSSVSRERLSKHPDLAVEVAVQAAEGLAFLHNRFIVHRDFQPDNLVLQFDAKSQRPMVKLLDAGLARHKRTAAGASTDHLTAGTDDFKAPEQWLAKEKRRGHIELNVDVWAFGLTLFSLLTGKNLWEQYRQHGVWGPREFAVAIKNFTSGSVPQLPKHPRINPALEALIVRCVRYNPNDRPSMNFVFATLRQIQSQSLLANGLDKLGSAFGAGVAPGIVG